MTVYEGNISFTFKAKDREEAEERSQEIWQALDWDNVPPDYDVRVCDVELG